ARQQSPAERSFYGGPAPTAERKYVSQIGLRGDAQPVGKIRAAAPGDAAHPHQIFAGFGKRIIEEGVPRIKVFVERQLMAFFNEQCERSAQGGAAAGSVQIE